MDVVVCLAIDRSNRDLADLLVMDRELSRLGVELEFVRDPRERTPQGDLFFQIKGAFAQYEHSMITERMRRGKLYTIGQGVVMPGKHVAYGYRFSPATRNLVIHEVEADIVRYIFSQLAEGTGTLNNIARALNEMGVPTPQGARLWRENTIGRIVANETYMGVWAYGRRKGITRPRRPALPTDAPNPDDMVRARIPRPRSEWLTVPVPAIVSEEVWHAAERARHRNSALSQRNRQREYLLSGIAYCADCAAILHGWKHDGPAHYLYYRCSQHQTQARYKPTGVKECRTKFVRVAALDTLVWNEAVRQISNPHFLRDALEAAKKDNPANVPITRQRLDTLTHQRAALHTEAERLLDLYLAGDIPKATYLARQAEHKRRERALDTAHEEIAGQLAEYEDKVRALETLSERFANIREGITRLNFLERRALLLSMGVQVSVRRAPNPRDGHLVSIDRLAEPVRDMPLPLPEAIRANQWTGPKTHREAGD
jgi:site-specific DNA recombinase